MIENQLIEQFKVQFKNHGRLFFSPGRINVIGEHTDYNQGFVLPTIIKQKFYVVIAKRGGLDPFPIIRISSPQYNDFIEFNLFTPPQKQWAKYFYGVIKEIQKRGKEITSIDVMIYSDIPVGAGLSSSAALCSAFGKALNGLFHLDLDLIDLAYIGQAVEHNYIGVKCGLMDQFASLFGKKETLIKLDCKNYDYEYIPFQYPEVKMVLFNSRVKHTLASSEYNVRRASCENVVHILQSENPDIQSLRDVSLNLLIENEKLIDKIDFKRAKYVIEENNRVINLCHDLKKGDLSSLHYLIFASHEGLRDQYEVSCPELDFLVESAQKSPGIIGARMMGGGFGGCTINFVETEQYELFINQMCAFFEKKYHKTAIYYEV
jgi:galactokinase